jgi:hypothetical protein
MYRTIRSAMLKSRKTTYIMIYKNAMKRQQWAVGTLDAEIVRTKSCINN